MKVKNPTNLENGLRTGGVILILLIVICAIVGFIRNALYWVLSLFGIIFSSAWVWIIVAIIVILLLVRKYRPTLPSLPSLPSTNKWFGLLVKIALAILGLWVLVYLCRHAYVYLHPSHHRTEVRNPFPHAEMPLTFGPHYLEKGIWHKTSVSCDKVCYVVTKQHSTRIEEQQDQGCWFIRAANQADSVVINKDPLPVH